MAASILTRVSAVVLLATPTYAWIPPHAPAGVKLLRERTAERRLPLRMVDKEEEIKTLEARLAELKRQEDAEAASPEGAEAADLMDQPSPAPSDPADPAGFDATTLSYRKRVSAVKATPPSEFLSEAWKEADEPADAEGSGAAVPLIGTALSVVVFIALAQIPVASELTSFYDGRGSQPVESPAQIRARYEALGYDTS